MRRPFVLPFSLLLWVFCFFAGTCQPPTSPPPPSPEALLAHAQAFDHAARFDSALVYYRRAAPGLAETSRWDAHILARVGISEQLEYLGQYQEAQAEAQAAVALAEVHFGPQHLLTAAAYSILAKTHTRLAQFDEAHALHEQALAIQHAHLPNRHPSLGTSYHRLGLNHIEQGQLHQAQRHYERALNITTSTYGEGSLQTAIQISSLGHIHRRLGYLDKAHTNYTQALNIVSNHFNDDHRYVANAYNSIGIFYNEVGLYDQANEYYFKAMAIFENIKLIGHLHYALLLGNIANNLLDQGRYYNSNIYINKSIDILNNIYTHNISVHNLNMSMIAGKIHAIVGNANEAIDIVNNILNKLSTHFSKDYSRTYATLNDVASTELILGNNENAIFNSQKAIDIYKNLSDQELQFLAITYDNIAIAHRELGNYPAAYHAHLEAIRILNNSIGLHNPMAASSYNERSQLYLRMGQKTEALHDAQMALAANLPAVQPSYNLNTFPFQDLLSTGEALESLELLARIHAFNTQEVSDLTQSLAHYRAAADLIAFTRSSYKTEGSKLHLAKSSRHLYTQGIQVAQRLHQLTDDDAYLQAAFQFAEQSKAALLRDALNEARIKAFVGIPDQLLQREATLRAELAIRERERFMLETGAVGANDDRLLALQDTLFYLRQQYEQHLNSLEAQYPQYYALKYQNRPLSLARLQATLPPHTNLIQYYLGPDTLYAFTLTDRRIHLTTLPRPPALETTIQTLREGIINNTYTPYVTHARQLYDLLLAPLEDHIGTDDLIIVPDGQLSYVPFEALLTADLPEGSVKDYRDLPYLIEARAVSYSYAAELLTLETSIEQPPRDRNLLAFAPVFSDGLPPGTDRGAFFQHNQEAAPTRSFGNGFLPGSRDEVEGILRLFNRNGGWLQNLFQAHSHAFVGREASEARLKQIETMRYRYLHLATHGFVNEQAPTLSGILLSPDESDAEDGILHLDEIYGLNLQADLVVLSACETGLGKLAEGEGILGLSRGFLYAGARNLMVSLWKAHDSATARLMTAFYEALLTEAATKPEALRTAKRRMIASSQRLARPYFWATFTLIGR